MVRLKLCCVSQLGNFARVGNSQGINNYYSCAGKTSSCGCLAGSTTINYAAVRQVSIGMNSNGDLGRLRSRRKLVITQSVKISISRSAMAHMYDIRNIASFHTGSCYACHFHHSYACLLSQESFWIYVRQGIKNVRTMCRLRIRYIGEFHTRGFPDRLVDWTLDEHNNST